MPVREHIVHVPYAELLQHFREEGRWTCIVCGGRVRCRFFGHQPQPRVPLFECERCGRRSDGCQTFEGHHLLYRYCPLEEAHTMRCGHWRPEWQRAKGTCPVCAAQKREAAA